MYRLRVIPVFLPPLRMRPGDPSLLLDTFIAEMNLKSRRKIRSVSPDVYAAFESYDWPGNVRELRNVLAYAFVIGDGERLMPGDLPAEVLLGHDPASEAPPPPQGGMSPEMKRIADALAAAEGRRAEAAAALGMSRVTLWRRMKALGMDA
jgi:transcriptional regulator with PAS, ATPase and Fis domain